MGTELVDRVSRARESIWQLRKGGGRGPWAPGSWVQGCLMGLQYPSRSPYETMGTSSFSSQFLFRQV